MSLWLRIRCGEGFVSKSCWPHRHGPPERGPLAPAGDIVASAERCACQGWQASAYAARMKQSRHSSVQKMRARRCGAVSAVCPRPREQVVMLG